MYAQSMWLWCEQTCRGMVRPQGLCACRSPRSLAPDGRAMKALQRASFQCVRVWPSSSDAVVAAVPKVLASADRTALAARSSVARGETAQQQPCGIRRYLPEQQANLRRSHMHHAFTARAWA